MVQSPWSAVYRKVEAPIPHRYLMLFTPELDVWAMRRLKSVLYIGVEDKGFASGLVTQQLLVSGEIDRFNQLSLLQVGLTALRAFYKHLDESSIRELNSNQGRYPQELQCALIQIENDLAGDLSVEQLANAASCSSSHLNRMFRHCLNKSVNQVVVEKRVHHAAMLLACSTQSIEQVAAASGFSSRHYLTRVFKKQMGVAPAAYRHRMSLT